jgi:hypothetical protein
VTNRSSIGYQEQVASTERLGGRRGPLWVIRVVLGLVRDMSGLPQTADISGLGWHFAFVPGAEMSGSRDRVVQSAKTPLGLRHWNIDDSTACVT